MVGWCSHGKIIPYLKNIAAHNVFLSCMANPHPKTGLYLTLIKDTSISYDINDLPEAEDQE